MIYIAFKSCINEAHRQKRSSYSVRKFLNLSALVFRGRSQADPDSFTFVLLAMFNICQSGNLKIPDFCLPVSPPPPLFLYSPEHSNSYQWNARSIFDNATQLSQTL